MRSAIIFCLALAGCSDWPELPAVSPGATTMKAPELLTYDELVAAQAAEEGQGGNDAFLIQRGAALRARAAALRAVPTSL